MADRGDHRLARHDPLGLRPATAAHRPGRPDPRLPDRANLDTGNVTMILALGLWAAQFCGAEVPG